MADKKWIRKATEAPQTTSTETPAKKEYGPSPSKMRDKMYGVKKEK